MDRSLGRSLQEQIRETVVSSVISGRFTPGARMPSTRKLATYLGISRITVSLAYQELVSQGYLASSAKSAFLVSPSAPVPRLGRVMESPESGEIGWHDKFASNLQGRRRIEKPTNWRDYPYPFIYGQMDMTLFDHASWRDCARRALGQRDFADMAGDSETEDDPMLVDYICSHTLPRRGINAAPNEILVTVGAQNALWIVVQLLARNGLHAAFENPGYPDIATALRWNGAIATPVEVDQDGLPPEDLPDGVGAVFVTPSHQSPTAVTMPMHRRQQLLEDADRNDYVIVEDDYEFEMSFLAPPSPALKSMDRSGRVIYVGSFSKALFPGLRLGYLVAPAAFIREARQLRSLILRHPPGHQQRTVSYFLSLGHYDALIRRMRLEFSRRRDAMVNALEDEGIEISGAANFGGTNLWIRGPDSLDSMRLATDLRGDGVLIEAGDPFFENAPARVPYFRIAYSSIPTEKIRPGIGKIARRLFSD